MKSFLNNAFVHVLVVAIFTVGTQMLTSNGWDSLTVGTIVHAVYEYILSQTSVGTSA
jgi:hypothetical protein